MPQMGLATAIERPDALAEAAVQRSRSWPGCTPRACEMKIERKGNAKLKPKIAVDSAHNNAARLHRRTTPPGLMGGVGAQGAGVDSAARREFGRLGPTGSEGRRSRRQ